MIEVIEGKPFVRPCRSIPSDGEEGSAWSTSIVTTFEKLTTLLPLAGGDGLRPSAARGEPRIAAALRAEAPWMEAALDVIADHAALSLWAGRPWLRLPPMLLHGPPGSGKTHFARRLGELAGTGSAALSYAGVSSNAELAGNPRGFRHQQPCFPACAMQRFGTANPLIVIDEVEKARGSSNGDAIAALLPLLERSSAARFYDGCLAAPIDLSHVNWLLTANDASVLPAPLLSRLHVIEVSGPGPEHAAMVLAALWRDVAREAGLLPSELPRLEAAAEKQLIRLFRNTRSVRRLKQAIQTVVAVSARHARRPVN